MSPSGPTKRDMAVPSEEMVTVGLVTRTHGVRGEVYVRAESDNPERFTPPARYHTNLPAIPLLILRGARVGNHGLIAEFAGITSLEAASPLVGVELLIPESDRRRLGTGEYWPDQLVGLEARIGEAPVGLVTDVVLGPQDRLVVTCRDGTAGEVPLVAPLVPEIDLDGGWVRIEPPDGLLDQL
ncbi:MAG: ribosome maturation factor RimM [bacterium]|nr:ribosome maturation factor RimM [bacterium]